MITDFQIVYDVFYSKITDDMFMEIDECQTEGLLEELLLNALPWFEFPRVNLNDYDLDNKCFNLRLTDDELNILATYMVVEWIGQQLASIEVIRMKFSGSDFKFTSQANHMSKLMALKKEYERKGFHLQRLYKRRKVDKNGVFRSTFGSIMAASVREGNVPTVATLSSDTGSNRVSTDEQWEPMQELSDDTGFTPDTNTSREGGWKDMKPVCPCNASKNHNNATDDNSWNKM